MPYFRLYRVKMVGLLGIFNVRSVALLSLSLCGSFCLALQSVYPAQNKEAASESTEKKIQELEEMKRGFESRVIYHENQADRLQFDDHTYLEMRRHRQLADENRAKAEAVQKEIDRLRKGAPPRPPTPAGT